MHERHKGFGRIAPFIVLFFFMDRKEWFGCLFNWEYFIKFDDVARSSFPSPFEVLSFQYPSFRNKKRSISCVLQKNKLKNNLINYYQLVPFFSCFSPLIQIWLYTYDWESFSLICRCSSENWKMSDIVYSLCDNGFNLSSSHFATA